MEFTISHARPGTLPAFRSVLGAIITAAVAQSLGAIRGDRASESDMEFWNESPSTDCERADTSGCGVLG